MLSGKNSISQYTPSNVAIWLVMSFQAGLLNIGGFFAGHLFVSHVTGFASTFGMALVENNFKMALEIAGVPIVFLIGAMISGFFVDLRLKLNKTPKYFITFGIIFVLTLVVFIGGVGGFFGEFGNVSEGSSYNLLLLLCLICGIQNGTISIVSRSVVRTTHLTGITTDLGLGLIRMLYSSRAQINEFEEKRATLMRLGIILFFILGSALGALIFSHFGFWGFVIPMSIAGALFYLMIYFHIKNH